MFSSSTDLQVHSNTASPPQLLVFIDTEEEFAWNEFSRSSTGVTNISHQHHAQKILNRFGIIPTYLVDYPVATISEGITPLRELMQSGLCNIGAQLHSWVTPPFEEIVTKRNSFQRNLPPSLEHAKIKSLTQAIEDNFGRHPRIFKAGRNGFGLNTAAALVESGYTMDNSVLPCTDLSVVEGPDFTGSPGGPFWLDNQHRVLEIPMTEGLVGLLSGTNPQIARHLLGQTSVRLRLPAILSRTRLLEKIRLTPEGITIPEAKRLTEFLLKQGRRTFVICYHSSSLLPGSTPYVRNRADLERFLGWLSDYIEYFFGALGGKAATPDDIYRQALTTSS